METHPTTARGRRRVPIAREGWRHIAVSAAVAAAVWLLGFRVAGGIAAMVAAFVVAFFRDPERTIPAGEHRIVAPADGRIIAIAPVAEGRLIGGPATRISIFMSPFDVHVNRMPIGGTVERVEYHRGKYFRAFAEKASLDNEQNAIAIRDSRGRRLCFVQIAGFLARRIVCYASDAMTVTRGERCGMIMFGSRADVYLPPDAKVLVDVGGRARGGETVLAEWEA